MFRFFCFSLIAATACFVMACNEGPRVMSNSSGKAGEVCIVMDKVHWEGELGATFRASLAAEYPFLPQSEPMFTLFNIPHNAFNSIFQSHRNIVLANISPDFQEAQMVIQERVWAAPQIVVTFSGPNLSSVLDCFAKQKQKLIGVLEQAERNRVINNAKRYENRGLRLLVNESFGGSPYFPREYALKKQEKNFIWITCETTYITQGVLIYSYPYLDSTSLSKKVMINECKTMLRNQVPGPLDNTWMTIATVVEPSLFWINYNDNDFAEMRGLWEVQNDFMGGPFLTHSYLDLPNRRVLVLHAFVYAPRYDKRNYLRQVESILYSFEWAEKQADRE